MTKAPVEPTDTALAKIDAARRALAEATTFEEVAGLRDKAAAWLYYLRRRQAGLEAQNAAAEFGLRCDRRLGELLPEVAPHGGSRQPASRSTSSTLTDLGLSKNESANLRRIAAIPEELFEAHLREVCGRHEELTVAGVLRLYRQLSRDGTEVRPPPPPQAPPRPDWREAPADVPGLSAAGARVLRLAGVKTAGKLAGRLDAGGLPTLPAADRAHLREWLAGLRGYDAPPREDATPDEGAGKCGIGADLCDGEGFGPSPEVLVERERCARVCDRIAAEEREADCVVIAESLERAAAEIRRGDVP